MAIVSHVVDEFLSSPEAIKNDQVLMDIIQSRPNFLITKKMMETGELCRVGADQLPGVTLGFDAIGRAKNYKNQEEYGYMMSDVKIPGNAPVSQLLHNEDGSRVLVPYSNLGQTPETIEKHAKILTESVIRVCERLGHPITADNIIVNYDSQGNFVLQIANKHVKNLKNNKEFTDLVDKDIEKYHKDHVLCAAIDRGYKAFRYNDFYQKYPLLKDVPEHTYGLLNKLISDPHTQPIIIQIFNGDHNTIHNTINSNNTVTSNSNNIITNNTTTVIVSSNLADSVTQFIDNIKSSSPRWYVEGGWIHIDTIRQYFDAFSNNKFKNSCSIKFNKLIKTHLGKRSGKKTIGGSERIAVLLKRYAEL